MDNIIGHLLSVIMIVVPCIGISIAYFIAGKSKPLPVRIIKSSHGLFIVSAFYFSLYAAQYTVDGNPTPWEITFNIIIAFAGISAILSLFKYVN